MKPAKNSPLFFMAAFVLFIISILWTFGPGSGFIGILCAILGLLFFGLGIIKAGQEAKVKRNRTKIDDIETGCSPKK